MGHRPENGQGGGGGASKAGERGDGTCGEEAVGLGGEAERKRSEEGEEATEGASRQALGESSGEALPA